MQQSDALRGEREQVVKCENILASLYVTWKRSRLTSAQSSVTGLYGVRHSPLLLLTLGSTVHCKESEAEFLFQDQDTLIEQSQF